MRAVHVSVLVLFAIALTLYLVGSNLGAAVFLAVGVMVELFALVTWFVTYDDKFQPEKGEVSSNGSEAIGRSVGTLGSASQGKRWGPHGT